MEEFNKLDDQSKRILIFEAIKIAERNDDFTKFELINIYNFFVETRTSPEYLFKRTMATYTLKDLPPVYSSDLQSSLLI